MCGQDCPSCSKSCVRKDGVPFRDGGHATANGMQIHAHEYSYGSYNRSGYKNIITVTHQWHEVPNLDDEVKRLV